MKPARRPTILLTRRLFPEAEAYLARRLHVVRPEGRRLDRRGLLAAAARAEGILCQLTDRIDDALLSRAPRLRAVSVCAVGYDCVDVTACARRGIAVAHTPDVLTEATADHTWALLLAAARRVVEADAVCRNGRFPEWDLAYMLGRQVAGSTLGVVGMGRIGRAVARRALGFGMRVLYHDRGPAPAFTGPDAPLAGRARGASLGALLGRSDFVTLHVPALPETRHLIGRREIAAMKPGAILVNTSRGSVVDESALVRALDRGALAGAGLDVFENEPAIPRALARMRQVVLTPHIASATISTRMAMAMLAARNLAEILAGRPGRAALVPGSPHRRGD